MVIRYEISSETALIRFLDSYGALPRTLMIGASGPDVRSSPSRPPGGKAGGRILAGREKAIIAMRLTVENTVKNSNGQIVPGILKNKELRMTADELEKLLGSLLDRQKNLCSLTDIPFRFEGPEEDANLLPSVDRINSDGHYEKGNLQVVCRFINFWKSNSDNAEFQRLLALVRESR